MSEHREEITEAAERYTASVREAREADEWGDEGIYDVEVWTSNHDRRKVDFLLAGGGPTIWVEVDQFDRATFHHSWGMDDDGRDRTTWEFFGTDEAFWVGMADEYSEIIACS